MAVIREKTLKFPGLDNVYTFADEADLFDANVPCAAGEYRIYEGELYRCDADHTGAWNYAHFTPVKLGNEVSTAMAASVGNFAQKTIENVAIATFDDGAENVPVKSLIISIEPVQSGSGDPAPDNVRPITGWAGANVVRTGVNVLEDSFELGSINNNTGYNIPSNDYMRSSNFVSIKPSTKYYLKASSGIFIKYYDENYNVITAVWDVQNAKNVEITTNSKARYLKVTFPVAMDTSDFCINYPSTDTDYHAYSGQTIPLTFPDAAGTVYGATLENHGTDAWKLRALMAKIVKSDTSGWVRGSAQGYYFEQADLPTPDGTNHADVLCNKLKSSNSASEFGSVYRNANYKTINIRTVNSYDSVAEMVADLGELEFVYPIATPIEYTITAEAAKTLLGLNNIWADTGDIDELIYRTMNSTDAKIRLTKALIAPVLDDMVAEEALSVNDFVIVGDTLYIITADVAADGTLTPGTNCTATTIGEQITALLNA